MNNMVYDTRTPRPKQTRPEYPSSQKKKTPSNLALNHSHLSIYLFCVRSSHIAH